jgi:hypothetical protein
LLGWIAATRDSKGLREADWEGLMVAIENLLKDLG